MRRIIIVIIALLFEPGLLSAQNHTVDSLKKELQWAKEDSAGVNILNSLGEVLSNEGYNDSAKKYVAVAEKLAEKINYKNGLAKALNITGLIYDNEGNYELALQNYLQSLSIRKETGDRQGVADSYNNIGLIYLNRGGYPKALENLLIALQIYESFSGTYNKNKIAYSYMNIANIYWREHNYGEATKTIYRELSIMEELGDSQGIALCYVSIGNIYNSEQDYTSALSSYSKALMIQKRINDNANIALTFNNIGTIYANRLNDNAEALKNYDLALEAWSRNGDKYHAAIVNINLGDLFAKQKMFEKAKKYLNRGLSISNEIGAKDNIKECYNSLAILSETMGDYKAALKYQKLLSDIKDTLLNDENSRQMAEMRAKYEAEKKEKEIELLTTNDEIKTVKIEKQRLTMKYLVGGFLLFVLFAITGIWLIGQRRKAAFKHEVLETKMNALRAQMNPHFTFNILNSIQYYAGENNMKAVQYYLRQFSKLIRMILDQSRTSYITLEQEISMLKLYMELEEMRFEKKFYYTLEVEAGLNPEKILIPGMLIQPIVENAIKHGIEHKEGEALINVSFYSRNSTLLCTVRDNGIGRAEAEKMRAGNIDSVTGDNDHSQIQRSTNSHKPTASAIIQERMEALSSIYNIGLECRTEDLFDSDGKPAGTCVTMEIPIKNN